MTTRSGMFCGADCNCSDPCEREGMRLFGFRVMGIQVVWAHDAADAVKRAKAGEHMTGLPPIICFDKVFPYAMPERKAAEGAGRDSGRGAGIQAKAEVKARKTQKAPRRKARAGKVK